MPIGSTTRYVFKKGVNMDIKISTEYIKLDQLLKFSGIIGNGSDAKILIFEGQVCVNGEMAKQRGKKIRSGDVVKVGEQIINVC